MRLPRPPVLVDPLLTDPEVVPRLVAQHAPYWPVQRYFASPEEMKALSDTRDRGPGLVVGPVFRGNWAYDRPLVDGVAPILGSERLAEAARRVFDAAIVRPQIVYVNLTLPMPAGDGGHTDVPAFRGIDRTQFPIWLLVTMGRSGLFERWRVHIATAVAWFYAGEGGALTYWPDGPDAPPRSCPPRTNTALVGDNDVMFHRVESVGGSDDDMVRGLTLDSELAYVGDGRWEVRDADRVLAREPFSRVRVSLSWKAMVFADAEAARVYDTHADHLAFPQVLDAFLSDLRVRGTPVDPPADPLHDPGFVRLLTRAYHQAPTVYAWGAASAD